MAHGERVRVGGTLGSLGCRRPSLSCFCPPANVLKIKRQGDGAAPPREREGTKSKRDPHTCRTMPYFALNPGGGCDCASLAHGRTRVGEDTHPFATVTHQQPPRPAPRTTPPHRTTPSQTRIPRPYKQTKEITASAAGGCTRDSSPPPPPPERVCGGLRGSTVVNIPATTPPSPTAPRSGCRTPAKGKPPLLSTLHAPAAAVH
jgi:hypothetical protein